MEEIALAYLTNKNNRIKRVSKEKFNLYIIDDNEQDACESQSCIVIYARNSSIQYVWFMVIQYLEDTDGCAKLYWCDM